jgi:hypothetical protein
MKGDKPAFPVDVDQILLARSDSVTQATQGVFKRFVETPRSAEELRISAEQAIASDVEERSY